MKPGNLLWLDLEMTGLEPNRHVIIEAAAIVTDWQLREYGSYQAVVQQPPEAMADIEDWSRRHHRASGLLAQVPEGKPSREVEAQLMELVAEYCGNQPVFLAGNSIHQDRRFIRVAWPKLDERLHYRMLDVSAWKIIMENRFNINVKKPQNHRALEDIRGSINELKHYVSYIKV